MNLFDRAVKSIENGSTNNEDGQKCIHIHINRYIFVGIDIQMARRQSAEVYTTNIISNIVASTTTTWESTES